MYMVINIYYCHYNIILINYLKSDEFFEDLCVKNLFKQVV